MNSTFLPSARRRRLCRGLAVWGGLAALGGLGACAGPRLEPHAGAQPVFDLRRYFDGTVLAHGMVSDRGGQVQRRFVVTIECRWNGDEGTLDEAFVFDDGERQRRVWRIRRLPDGRYSGTADDVVGEAIGTAAGPAFNWRYTLRLPVRGSVYDIEFDDWMYQIDQRTVLNRATMSKFGITVGDVVLSFHKQ
jgi:hypothetical protein